MSRRVVVREEYDILCTISTSFLRNYLISLCIYTSFVFCRTYFNGNPFKKRIMSVIQDVPRGFDILFIDNYNKNVLNPILHTVYSVYYIHTVAPLENKSLI